MTVDPLPASPTLADLARRLDDALAAAELGPVLVYGTPPPGGRDLDLLAPPAQAALLRQRLASWGFEARRHRWARFRGGSAQVVEVTPLDAWGLPDDAAEDLFDQARPLPGHQRLCTPGPAGQLLIAARRLASAGGSLSERSRGRVQQALSLDPTAWEQAAERAPAWAARRSLALLQAAVADPTARPAAGPRLAARLARLRTPGGTARLAGALFEPGDAAVVALSGLDGAGKSTLSAMLQQVLTAAGLSVAVEWTPGHDPSIGLPEPLKQVAFTVLSARSKRPAKPAPTPAPDATPPPTARLSGDEVLGSQAAGTRQLVATAVAILGAVGMHRATAAHRARGRLVICDRYVLDNAVKLRGRYRLPGRLAPQIGLLQALSPRARHAFLLELPGAVAHARKPQAYSAEQLQQQAAVYREEAGHLGVVRLDGQRPTAELCDEIATRIWQAWR